MEVPWSGWMLKWCGVCRVAGVPRVWSGRGLRELFCGMEIPLPARIAWKVDGAMGGGGGKKWSDKG